MELPSATEGDNEGLAGIREDRESGGNTLNFFSSTQSVLPVGNSVEPCIAKVKVTTKQSTKAVMKCAAPSSLPSVATRNLLDRAYLRT